MRINQVVDEILGYKPIPTLYKTTQLFRRGVGDADIYTMTVSYGYKELWLSGLLPDLTKIRLKESPVTAVAYTSSSDGKRAELGVLVMSEYLLKREQKVRVELSHFVKRNNEELVVTKSLSSGVKIPSQVPKLPIYKSQSDGKPLVIAYKDNGSRIFLYTNERVIWTNPLKSAPGVRSNVAYDITDENLPDNQGREVDLKDSFPASKENMIKIARHLEKSNFSTTVVKLPEDLAGVINLILKT